MLFKDLRQLEADRGIAALPAIVISPFPNLKLDSTLLGGRNHDLLPSPFTLAHLAATVNRLIPPEAGVVE
jgi:hypothetical protein